MFLQNKGLPNYPYSGVVLHSRPLLNILQVPSAVVPAQRSVNIKNLMSWVKKTPEAMGIVRRISQDIVTKIEFESVDVKRAGRPSKDYNSKVEDKAKEFSERNMLKQELITAVIDWLITGDAFLWLGKISESQIKEIVSKKYKELNIQFKEATFKAEDWLDEDYQGINVIQTIASTSVQILPTDTKIESYIQRVGTQSRTWFPNEVIHAKFMTVDGNVYGFTPMEACSPVIRTLGLIKDYAGTYFENGGVPDFVFNFPKEMAGSKNVRLLEQTLQKYKGSANKHGNLVIAGEVKIDPLGQGLNKDMEHRQLAIYYTGILAFSFGMPADVLKPILGVEIKGSSGGSDNEDSGYNRNLEESQEYWENLLNTQCFYKYFSVRMKLKRRFMQDWIRLTQGRVQAIQLVKEMISLEFPVTDDFYIDQLKIPREYLTEGKIKKDLVPNDSSYNTKDILPDKKLIKGPNSQAYQESKKSQAKSTEEK